MMTRAALLALCGLCALHTAHAQYAPRLNFGAKFELDDVVLHGVGQSEELALASYAAALPTELFPRIYMAYLPSKADDDRRERTLRPLRDIAAYYPADMSFQIGVSMTTGSAVGGNVPYTGDIVAGIYDDNIDALARALDSLGREVFVRVGYEANGAWNAYVPEDYLPAYRHVVDRMRAVSDRFAFVWCIHPIDSIEEVMRYYPGDGYADWWAIDLFEPRFLTNATTAAFLARATAAGKPVMIGESTPTREGVGEGQASWEGWYATYFAIVRDNPVVKAFCYINRNWAHASSLTDWGNALIQTDSVVLARYIEEMRSPLYAHLPLDTGHRTAVLSSSDVTTVSRSGRVYDNVVDFPAGVLEGDSVTTVIRFALEAVSDGEIAAAKVWLNGRNDAPRDAPLRVLEVSPDYEAGGLAWDSRPAALSKLGEINVNDGTRDKLYWVDATAAVRYAVIAGTSVIAVGFEALPASAALSTFQGPGRVEAYAPVLQVVYRDLRAPEPASRAGGADGKRPRAVRQ